MFSYAQTGRSRVISCHLRDIGCALVMVGYISYHEKEPCVNNEKRPDGMMVVQQQGMEVFGCESIPVCVV